MNRSIIHKNDVRIDIPNFKVGLAYWAQKKRFEIKYE